MLDSAHAAERPPSRAPLRDLAALVVVGHAPRARALGASAATSKSTTTTTTTTHSIECTAAQLSFARSGSDLCHRPAKQAFTITLTNVSTGICQVHGYPSLRFYTSAGRLLTFAYRHTSVSTSTPRAPRVVGLAPHAHAYFVMAKARCTTAIRYRVEFFYVLPPYTPGAPWVGHVSPAGVRPSWTTARVRRADRARSSTSRAIVASLSAA